MSKPKLYGIKNCDTMKKAFRWLDGQGINYDFHDYKKAGAEKIILKQAVEQYGWEKVINRRGTTWRKLPEDVRGSMDDRIALMVAAENPSVIKRPLLAVNDKIILGFDAECYLDFFKNRA